MSKLQRALKQTRPPAIYRFTSQASVQFLENEASHAGWRLFCLDGSKIRDKKTFLDNIARAMEFPAYFGKNWDALNDMLTDVEWARAAGYIVLFQDPERFIKNAPDDWGVAVDIFTTTIEFWKEQGIPFYILLRGVKARDDGRETGRETGRDDPAPTFPQL